jgi:hypothetical protein
MNRVAVHVVTMGMGAGKRVGWGQTSNPPSPLDFLKLNALGRTVKIVLNGLNLSCCRSSGERTTHPPKREKILALPMIAGDSGRPHTDPHQVVILV